MLKLICEQGQWRLLDQEGNDLFLALPVTGLRLESQAAKPLEGKVVVTLEIPQVLVDCEAEALEDNLKVASCFNDTPVSSNFLTVLHRQIADEITRQLQQQLKTLAANNAPRPFIV